jgi:ribonuclease P protein component
LVCARALGLGEPLIRAKALSQTSEEQSTLPKHSRIVRTAEFKKVYQSGVRVTSRYFAAFCFSGSRDGSALPARCGFTLPKALGRAVTRNRIRRRLREAVRTHLGQLPAGWLIVFNPRRSALEAPFEELANEVGRIFERCNRS